MKHCITEEHREVRKKRHGKARGVIKKSLGNEEKNS